MVGGLEVLPFGFLIFVAGALILANAWAVVDAKMAVEDAAREAARAYVESDGAGSAGAVAREAAVQAMAGAGRHGERLGLVLSGRLVRCAPVDVETSYRVEAIRVPFVGGFGRGVTVHGHHREVVDPFAAGLGPENDCGL